jgi:hypothetical protein
MLGWHTTPRPPPATTCMLKYLLLSGASLAQGAADLLSYIMHHSFCW